MEVIIIYTNNKPAITNNMSSSTMKIKKGRWTESESEKLEHLEICWNGYIDESKRLCRKVPEQ